MKDLEKFINENELCNLDPLIKMAIIHYQFESIHPFYDGNGRTGRIINILYLCKQNLLNSPILYLSSYIVRHKSDYYKYLQEIREQENWQNWFLYIIDAVNFTALDSINKITKIKELLLSYKQKIRNEANYLYSQDLINNLFQYPYTRAEYLSEAIDVSTKTANTYLNKLVELNLLTKEKRGKKVYFINHKLIEILTE